MQLEFVKYLHVHIDLGTNHYHVISYFNCSLRQFPTRSIIQKPILQCGYDNVYKQLYLNKPQPEHKGVRFPHMWVDALTVSFFSDNLIMTGYKNSGHLDFE